MQKRSNSQLIGLLLHCHLKKHPLYVLPAFNFSFSLCKLLCPCAFTCDTRELSIQKDTTQTLQNAQFSSLSFFTHSNWLSQVFWYFNFLLLLISYNILKKTRKLLPSIKYIVHHCKKTGNQLFLQNYCTCRHYH